MPSAPILKAVYPLCRHISMGEIPDWLRLSPIFMISIVSGACSLSCVSLAFLFWLISS